MWPRTRLPHCGHLVSCGACQRLAAFRVRSLILDVFRFGTPIVNSSFLSSIRLRQPTHLAGLLLSLPPLGAVPLDQGKF